METRGVECLSDHFGNLFRDLGKLAIQLHLALMLGLSSLPTHPLGNVSRVGMECEVASANVN
jgi:hypothetical protein